MSDEASLRRLGPAVDADAAWLRAAVECFEPRLRELDARGAPGEGAWGPGGRPNRGCGWTCSCCPRTLAAGEILDLDAIAGGRRPRWPRRGGTTLGGSLAAAAAAGRAVVLGARRDPYQGPPERRERTREILEASRDVPDLQLVLLTRSPLVLCDGDLLLALDAAGSTTVELALDAPDAATARELEPGGPAPREILGAAAELAAEGLAVRLRLAPLLPGLTDGAAALLPLVAAAAAAGVHDLAASPLRLDRATRRRFLPWLAARRPGLVALYRDLYGRRASLRPADRTACLADFHRLRLEHGFPRTPPGRG